jgi:hypothetical protein
MYSNFAVYILSMDGPELRVFVATMAFTPAPNSRFSCNIFLQQPSLQRANFLPFLNAEDST